MRDRLGHVRVVVGTRKAGLIGEERETLKLLLPLLPASSLRAAILSASAAGRLRAVRDGCRRQRGRRRRLPAPSGVEGRARRERHREIDSRTAVCVVDRDIVCDGREGDELARQFVLACGWDFDRVGAIGTGGADVDRLIVSGRQRDDDAGKRNPRGGDDVADAAAGHLSRQRRILRQHARLQQRSTGGRHRERHRATPDRGCACHVNYRGYSTVSRTSLTKA